MKRLLYILILIPFTVSSEVIGNNCEKSFAILNIIPHSKTQIGKPLSLVERESSINQRLREITKLLEEEGPQSYYDRKSKLENEVGDIIDELSALSKKGSLDDKEKIFKLNERKSELEKQIKNHTVIIRELKEEKIRLTEDLHLLRQDKKIPVKFHLSPKDFAQLTDAELQSVADMIINEKGTVFSTSAQVIDKKITELIRKDSLKIVEKIEEQLPTRKLISFDNVQSKLKLTRTSTRENGYLEDSFFMDGKEVKSILGHYIEFRNPYGVIVKGVGRRFLEGGKISYFDAKGNVQQISGSAEDMLISDQSIYYDYAKNLTDILEKRVTWHNWLMEHLRISLANKLAPKVSPPIRSEDLLKQILEKRESGSEAAYRIYSAGKPKNSNLSIKPSTKTSIMVFKESSKIKDIRVVALTRNELDQLPLGTRVIDLTADEPKEIIIGIESIGNFSLDMIPNPKIIFDKIPGQVKPQANVKIKRGDKLTIYGISPDSIPAHPKPPMDGLNQSFQNFIQAYEHARETVPY